jgi:hypothetical protein
MKLNELGWNDVSTGDFPAYKEVIDTYFSFGKGHLKSAADKVESDSW